jgi:F0F1-type ATP synthase membrane subunit b/b'
LHLSIIIKNCFLFCNKIREEGPFRTFVMPQLDISYYLSQIFWLLISFSSLYYVCSSAILPLLDKVLVKRSSLIENNINFAKQVISQVKLIEKDLDSKLHNAKNYSHSLLSRAKNELEEVRSKKTAILEDNIKALYSRCLIDVKKDIDDASQVLISDFADISNQIIFLIDKSKYHSELPFSKKTNLCIVSH